MAAFGGKQGPKISKAPTMHRTAGKPAAGSGGATGHGAGHVHSQKNAAKPAGGKPTK